MSTSSVQLPEVLVVGAQKAGTTSLDAWLRLQPELALPQLKETHFLSDDERYAKGALWYDAQFSGRAGRRVEVDPDYLSSVAAPARARRLFEGRTTPGLIAILREPLGRARSHWRMSVRRGLEQRSFAEALLASWQAHQTGKAIDAHSDYYGRGRYVAHLATWMQALPDARLLILTFEDLVQEALREHTFERICDFIGLDAEPVLPDFEAIKNPAGAPRSGLLNRVLHRRSGLRSALGKLIPSQDLRLRIGVLLEGLNTKPSAPIHTVGEVLDARVLAAMQVDVRALAALTERDGSRWLERLEPAQPVEVA